MLLSRFLLATVSILAGSAASALAQKNNPDYDHRKLHFGFTLAYNSSIFRTQNSSSYLLNDTLHSITPKSMPGFGLGVLADAKLGKHMSLRLIPSLHFATKRMIYTFQDQEPVTKQVESAYVDIPLLLKLKSDRLENFRLYTVAGVKYSIDMSSQAKVQDDKEALKVVRSDYSVDYGVGADFFLPYFKFSPEIRISQGLRNILVPEQHVYANSIDYLRSRTLFLSLYFE